MLRDWLPKHVLNQLAVADLLSSRAGVDICEGISETCCDVTVSNAYALLDMYKGAKGNNRWKDIWKLNGTERVRRFVWLLKHNGLLTNNRKNKMGLGSAMCKFCGNEKKNALHVLRDCRLARPIWLEMEQINKISSFILQRWRNKEIHDEHFIRPTLMENQIYKQVGDYNPARNISITANQEKQMNWIKIRWETPSEGKVKVNSDVARDHRGVAGCGGIIRGNEGEWLGGYTKHLGLCQVYKAELCGVLEGLELAIKMGFKNIDICVDSHQVYEDINNNYSFDGTGSKLIKRIKDLFQDNIDIKVMHVFWEANRCADILAKRGIHIDDYIYYKSCPDFTTKTYEKDCASFERDRLIDVN